MWQSSSPRIGTLIGLSHWLPALPTEPAHEAFSIPLGYGVAGWVAVNATALVNADAGLAFQQSSPYQGLVRSICVSVVIRGQAAGVSRFTAAIPAALVKKTKP
jgi:hypothetical protein